MTQGLGFVYHGLTSEMPFYPRWWLVPLTLPRTVVIVREIQWTDLRLRAKLTVAAPPTVNWSWFQASQKHMCVTVFR